MGMGALDMESTIIKGNQENDMERVLSSGKKSSC